MAETPQEEQGNPVWWALKSILWGCAFLLGMIFVRPFLIWLLFESWR